MKATKKILSLVLALMMVLSCVSVLAEEDKCPQSTDGAHHYNEETTVNGNPCTEGSYTVKKCVDCGKEEKTVITEPIGKHNLKEETKEATCGEAGWVKEICQNEGCDYSKVVKEIPATGKHTPKLNDDGTEAWEWSKNSTADCTKAGEIEGYLPCADCSAVVESTKKEDPQKVHDFSVYFKMKDGVCTGEAEESEYSKDPAYVAANITVTVTAPTCIKEGKVEVKCALCGKGDEKPLAKVEHNYVADTANTTEATCAKEGSTVKKCDVCGDVITVVSPKKDHDFENGTTYYYVEGKEPTTVQPADCEAYTVKERCANYAAEGINCKGEKVVSEHKAGKHDFPTTPNVIVKKAACGVEGTGLYVCTQCGFVKQDTIKALKHDEVGKVTKNPTCTETGLKVWTCEACGETRDEVLPAVGHNFITTITGDTDCNTSDFHTEIKECSRCHVKETTTVANEHEIPMKDGKEDLIRYDHESCGKAGAKTFVCTKCSEQVTKPIPATEKHTPGEWTTVKEASCKGEGNKEVQEKRCTVCKAVLETKEVGEIPSHTEPTTAGSVIKTEPTCHSVGHVQYNCADCGDYVNKELKVLEHNVVVTTDKEGNYILKCQNPGCTYTETIEKVNPTYKLDVSAVNKSGTTSGKGKVELTAGERISAKMYVRMSWSYTLSDGSTMMYPAMKQITWNEDGTVGTFDTTSPSKPFGSTLDDVTFNLTTTANADSSMTFDSIAAASK